MIVIVCLVALALVVLSTERAVAGRAWRAERRTLLNALVARTPVDFVHLERESAKERHPSRGRTERDDDPVRELVGL